MKKLILPVYKKNDFQGVTNKYYILFNIGQRLEFSSKRKAEDYSRKVSSYVVDSIRLSNTIQKELYSIYLDNYFIFNDSQCYKIHHKLDEYLGRLKYFHSYQSKGDACIKFISVYSLLNIVQEAAKLLVKALKTLKNYNCVGRVNSYLQMLSSIYDNLALLKKGDLTTVYKESILKIVYKRVEVLKA